MPEESSTSGPQKVEVTFIYDDSQSSIAQYLNSWMQEAAQSEVTLPEDSTSNNENSNRRIYPQQILEQATSQLQTVPEVNEAHVEGDNLFGTISIPAEAQFQDRNGTTDVADIARNTAITLQNQASYVSNLSEDTIQSNFNTIPENALRIIRIGVANSNRSNLFSEVPLVVPFIDGSMYYSTYTNTATRYVLIRKIKEKFVIVLTFAKNKTNLLIDYLKDKYDYYKKLYTSSKYKQKSKDEFF